jgi:hypothetical protein
MRGGRALGGARSRRTPDPIHLCPLWTAGDWMGRRRYSLSGRQPLGMKARGLFSKPPPKGQGVQLGLLCACGRRPIELRGLRCCRLCYYRQYDSRRWFGGLRDLILKRDRFRCRACGSARRLVVHHRYERNASSLLITLCIRCHVRLHHSRRFRSWVPEALLGLWNELHPSEPLQLQLAFNNEGRTGFWCPSGRATWKA